MQSHVRLLTCFETEHDCFAGNADVMWEMLVPTALAGTAGQVGPGTGQVCGDGDVISSLESSGAELGI